MRVIIIGGGAAGTACAQSFTQTLATGAKESHPASVTVVDRLEQPVELPPLSKSLAAEEVSVVPHVVGEHTTRVHATALNVRPGEDSRYVVETSAGDLPADTVVYATGLVPRTPPIEALTVYNRESAQRAHDAIRALQPGASVGVLGSGFLALEIARGLADAGHHPHVYLRGERPLPRVSSHLAEAVVALHTGVTFVPHTPDPDPARHPLWFAAVGAEPTGPTLPEEQTEVGDTSAGYPVGADLQVVGHPGIYAIGDCARIQTGPMRGIIPAEAAATSMGRWLGTQLAQQSQGQATDGETWVDVPWHWSFQGPVRIFTAGAELADTSGEPVTVGDPARRAQWLFFHPTTGRLARVETLNNPGGHNAAKRVLAGGDLPHKNEVDESFDMRAWANR